LDALKRIKGTGYVYTTTGDTPVSGWSKAKKQLDKSMGELAAKEGKEREGRWTLHDLRRTAASGMARIGVQLPVIEKVLNHRSGSFAGIVGVYQRHDFANEKRAALEAWGREVERIVAGKSAEIIRPAFGGAR
jgi:integrase